MKINLKGSSLAVTLNVRMTRVESQDKGDTSEESQVKLGIKITWEFFGSVKVENREGMKDMPRYKKNISRRYRLSLRNGRNTSLSQETATEEG